MKKRLFQMIAMGAAVATGTVILLGRHDTAPADPPVAMEPAPEAPQQQVQILPATVPEPVPVQRDASPPEPQKPRPPVSRPVRKPSAEQQRAAMIKYWKNAEDNFNRLWDQLEQAQDPGLRSRLINQMAQYIRMDTLGTVEWAMGLEDAQERRLAMEAINKYAISGIGARIQVDDTGFPQIQETTALSAVGSTGLVEQGDYIIGMVNSEGQTVDFEGMPIQEIVQQLRGEPGSELVLLMERAPAGQDGDSYPFDVPVQRSLLVIQPPY